MDFLHRKSIVNVNNLKIAVIGLGYVGLPLAVALARFYPVMGFDIAEDRVAELKQGIDRTREVESNLLNASPLGLTCTLDDIKGCNLFIVTVPTPVHEESNTPDLSPLHKACESIGPLLKKGDTVVFESTVYPGVTEDVCGPLLAEHSKLKPGKDFYLGYSPERINPGDQVHTVDKITKVVAGQTPEVAALLKTVYGKMNGDNIFVAANIKTAEAAKVIENTQRDINIAFMNEIATIFKKMDLSIYDVLDAARTKWNFLPFTPGLVGGHCIGVDPYYLADCAQKLGHTPEIILAGRKINENMSTFIAEQIHAQLKNQPSKILVLGLTFKENVPDLRNTKVIDLVQSLSNHGHQVAVHDACANPEEAKLFFEIDLLTSLEGCKDFDAIVGAVPHQGYVDMSPTVLQKMLKNGGLVADLKNIWRDQKFDKSLAYWSL
jgi:UDP-N-acetyl-D-galactosamine dehydrogenase